MSKKRIRIFAEMICCIVFVLVGGGIRANAANEESTDDIFARSSQCSYTPQAVEIEFEHNLSGCRKGDTFSVDISYMNFIPEDELALESYIEFHQPVIFSCCRIDSIERSESKIYSLTFSYLYDESAIRSRISAWDKEMKRFREGVNSNWSDSEKAMYIYNYLQVNCEYTSSTQYSKAYDAFVDHRAYCAGYAKTVMYLADELKLDSYYVFNNSNYHFWNVVKVDGYYYHMDSAWADKKTNAIGETDFSLFLNSSNKFHNNINLDHCYVFGMNSRGGKAPDVSVACTSTRYDNSVINKTNAAIVFVNGKWYASFANSSNPAICDLYTLSVKNGVWAKENKIAVTEGKWTSAKGKVYSGKSRVAGEGYYVLYTASNKVYRYDTVNKKNVTLYTLSSKEASQGQIFGMRADERGMLTIALSKEEPVSGTVFSNISVDVYNHLDTPKTTAENVNGGVKVSWKKVEGADGYSVYRRTENGSWQLLKSVSADTFSYTDKSAVSSTKYQYTSRAYRGNLKSDFVGTSYLMYLKCPSVSVKNGTKGVAISWDKIQGAKTYAVYRKEYETNGPWVKLATVSGTSFVDTSAKDATSYTYTVRSVCDKYASNFIIFSPIRFYAAPVVGVKSFTYIDDFDMRKNGVQITWDDHEDRLDYGRYVIYMKQPGTSWKKIALSSMKDNSYFYELGNNPGTYYFTVRIEQCPKLYQWDMNYSTPVSDFVSSEIQYIDAPQVSFSQEYSHFTVKWSQNGKTVGGDEYILYRKKEGEGWKELKRFNTSVHSYNDDSVQNGIKYKYTVRLHKGNAISTFVDPDFVEYLYLPGSEVKLSENVDQSGHISIRLEWKPVKNSHHYYIYRRKEGQKWEIIDDISLGELDEKYISYTTCYYYDRKAVIGETYYYTVRPVAENGAIGDFVSSDKYYFLPKPNYSVSVYNEGTFPSNIALNIERLTNVDGYLVYMKVNGGAWKLMEKIENPTDRNAYFNYGGIDASKNEVYQFAVRAYIGNELSTFIASEKIMVSEYPYNR